MTGVRATAILTVDFEDYRRQQLRDVLGNDVPPSPAEVLRQLELLLNLFNDCAAEATFLSVGRLVNDLPSSVWTSILRRHRVGAHSYEHQFVDQLGPRRFADDVRKAKAVLEDAAGCEVLSFRAPYFSNDGCDPWFGEILAEAGYRIDSSVRLTQAPVSPYTLAGSGGRVVEIPLPCYGVGRKRLTVIGGTYFRLLPFWAIERLLKRAESDGFTPMIYLHPYDIDTAAAPLDFHVDEINRGSVVDRAGDLMRRSGRGSVAGKLRELSQHYRFLSLETFVTERVGSLAQVGNA